MLTSQVFKSRTGLHYTLRLTNKGISSLPSSIKAESFSDENIALHFVHSLQVPLFFWENLAQENSFFNYHNWNKANPWISIESYIAQALIQGSVQAFKSGSLTDINQSIEKRRFKQSGLTFEFLPASCLLTDAPKEQKQFSSLADTQNFLNTLYPAREQLTDLVHSLNLNVPASSTTNASAMNEALGQALIKGEIVITQEAEARKPEAQDIIEEVAEVVSSNTQEPAPAQTTAEEEDDEEKVCELTKLTVACDHDGRKQIVTSDSSIVPSLNVVASEKDKGGFEKITAKIEANAPCDNHTSSSTSIQPSPAKTTKGSLSNVYELACEPVTNPLNVLWLPSIKPKRYKISANACDRFSTSAVEVNVFPKIKWNASVGYSFGNKELSRSTSENKNTGQIDVVNKHENKSGKFHGKMELYYDEKKKDFAGDYKNNIDKVLANIDDVTNKVDSLLKNLSNGEYYDSGVKLEIFWPNLSIKYEAELLENKQSTEVMSTYSLSVAADPLIGIKGSIDLFPAILTATKGTPVGAVVAAAVKGVGNEKSFASLKADIQLVLSLDAKAFVNFTTKGTNGKDSKDCKSEQAIAMDFQFETLIGAKGHFWVIKFEKNYRAGIKSGFVGKSVIERDDIGYYWYCRFLFNGLVIVFTKYEKLEKNVSILGRKKSKYSKIPDQIEESTSKEIVLIPPSPDEEAPQDTDTAEGCPETQSNNRRYLIKF
ncbi:hypothetical protein [Colwellia psychrerythraea]|uniref:Uncharacterized protein n=1 Tax=Colwellia psychrerythraea TaxID=28229 RepID=A0A099KY30_COLPS|nr:hypothetical protein [Colwellia psychrerythraea]KGJ94787.1 hypothetical protein GAB14E_2021 [Colwellia psychrerythraea]